MEKFLRQVHSVLEFCLPRTPLFDRFCAWVLFIITQHRMPRPKRLYFNDQLYRIKSTDAIMEPLRQFVSDKEYLRMYVAHKVGDEFNVPYHAILRSPAEVDAYDFPAECCVKPTHASGRYILRRHGEPIDREEIKRWFSVNRYRTSREANYRYLEPKIIVEPLIAGRTDNDEFKVFCYRGKPRLIQAVYRRREGAGRELAGVSYLDAAWNRLPVRTQSDPGAPPARPANLDSMLEAAARLSEGFDFIRIDFYSDGNFYLVGEITNCHNNATTRFRFTDPARAGEDAEAFVSRLIFSE